MSLSPAAQAHALALCLAAGALLGLLYDLLRQLRLAPLPRWTAALLDLLFWPLVLGCLFACALTLGDGHVRLYMAAGLFLGALLYFLLLSPPVRVLLALLARLAGGALRLLSVPLRLPARQIRQFSAKVQKSWKTHFHFSHPGSKINRLYPARQSAHPGRRPSKEARFVLRSKKAGILLRIVLVAILIYMVFLLVHVRQQITATQAEIRNLTEEVADQTQTNTELTNAIENRDDPSFLKDVARERLDLVTPNDRVFYITD